MRKQDKYFIAFSIGAFSSYILCKMVNYWFIIPLFIFTLLIVFDITPTKRENQNDKIK